MTPSSAGRELRSLGYRAKLCLLCDLDLRQRAAVVTAVVGNYL
jgi:hypothetical protein